METILTILVILAFAAPFIIFGWGIYTDMKNGDKRSNKDDS